MADYHGPAGLRTRGTVLIVPGRGESAAAYWRFGARLAADSYRVRVVAAPAIDGLDGTLDQLADALAVAVREIDSDLARPLVLVGSDSGAVALGALVARGDTSAPWWPQAVVLAGLPGYGDQQAGQWDEELDARSHCAVYRGVLSDDADGQRGALDAALPDELLDSAYNSTVDLPHVLLVGDADPFADRDALARAAKVLPAARLVVVRGAHHDVLNDVQHRSVAAEIVTFLEVLRNEPSLERIVLTESSAW